MNDVLSRALALLLVLVVAPAVPGLATRTRSFLTGRRGPPVLQLYADLWKLAQRGTVYSRATTIVFRTAPVVVLATTLLAALLVPLDGTAAILQFSADVVAFAGLLAMGRFALVLAACDTGSSFEGMGASREVAFAPFIDAALFVGFGAVAAVTGTASLSAMFGAPLAASWPGAAPSLVLVGISLFALLLAECARVPVDDPATHLELTMIHEVAVLDHSGPDLALLLYAGAVKLSLLGALVAALVVPRAAGGSVGSVASMGALLAGLAGVAVAVGIVESVMARLRLPKVPLYLAGGGLLALIALTLVLR